MVRWAWDSSRNFTVSSPYASQFVGRQHDLAATMIWDCRAPLRCKFFTLLALRHRCWMSNRLARRGLPYQYTCPLCNQMPECIDHLPVSCVFARSVCHPVLIAWGKVEWTPGDGDQVLDLCTKHTPQPHHTKDFKTIMVLVL